MNRMKLMLFNTESHQLEEISSRDGGAIRLYTCGPTIYDFAHIGNFRTYVAEDLLKRTLRLFGYPVVHAMNVTDVDDKTIRGALAKSRSLKEYTEPFLKAFFEDLTTLNIEKADYYPEATEYVSEMIQIIQTLMDKGYAYRSPNGSIYFSIRKFPAYGKLSHLRQEDLKPNASGENEADEYDKENIADFVLWKAYDSSRDGTIFWESPFGRGRPGWHIECSAMAMKLLGVPVDIHCGGVDNIFPHHENEIAQSECYAGQIFSRYWMHVEHLVIDHKKMSKSLGNFYTLRDLLRRGFFGRQVRYLLLSTHYRTQLNFTFQGLDAAKASLQRIDDLVVRLGEVNGKGESVHDLLLEADRSFQGALADDLNISPALAVLFDLIRELHTLCDTHALSREGAQEALETLQRWDGVLGLGIGGEEEPIPAELLDLLARREQARKERNFRLSDQIRDEISCNGYVVEDTTGGARLKKKK